MNNRIKSILEKEIVIEPSLAEECEKYGIEYKRPSFRPVAFIASENDAVVPYFYLDSDLKRSEKLRSEINEYNKVFWYYRDNEKSINPFKGMAAVMKYNRAVKKLIKVASAENIRLYSTDEMNEYIDNYDNQIRQDIERVKSKKEEMSL